MQLICILGLLLCVFWQPLQAATYYISPSGNDSNTCTAAQSQSTPRATLDDGSACLLPGDTLIALPGTYVLTEQARTTPNGTAQARITYQGYGAVLDGQIPFQHATGWCLWLQSGDYVDVEGFELTTSNWHATTANPACGFWATGEHITIRRLYVHHIPAAGYEGAGGSCILSDGFDYTGVDAVVEYNRVHDCGWQIPGADHRVNSIYVAHPQVVVRNNIVYRCQGTCIAASHGATQNTISNNLVFQGRDCLDCYGIYVGCGVEGCSPPWENSVVANNIILDVATCLIENGETGSNNQYPNNTCYNFGTLAKMFGSLPGTLVNTQTSNPQFVNYQADGSGDYQLTAGSPAINTGTTIGAPVTDYVGVERPRLFKIDRGPYEYVPACF